MFSTKKGDNGYTGILGPGRIPKYDPRIEAVGVLDELTSILGIARAVADDELKNLLLDIQKDIGSIAAQVADLKGESFRREGKLLEKIESELKKLEERVELPKKFIYPGVNLLSAILDFARTIARKAERRLDELFYLKYLEDEEVIRYMNRLSSLLYALARMMEGEELE